MPTLIVIAQIFEYYWHRVC